MCRVCTALVMLASEPPAPISALQMAVPVSIMIAREVTMASLREWAAGCGQGASKVGGSRRGREGGVLGRIYLWAIFPARSNFCSHGVGVGNWPIATSAVVKEVLAL